MQHSVIYNTLLTSFHRINETLSSCMPFDLVDIKMDATHEWEVTLVSKATLDVTITRNISRIWW